ncbi:RagB/SusD family nutrient uptake outer membrane protein [Chitinophaga lutea]|uniref:RagB/SusD family nutrient uptake outer membrane protein n=1 Tax=Chitinophaga lutea TaxID=2488634 RepID=A0A3N4QC18_9BACT|nr:RagB/SusD family nutrient uptake outer membrane protein [Chitinophaga lutea]RPE13517.1 RagB/SusD family nutrient uptake outer membrane protein [Chitinophaga lutea]
MKFAKHIITYCSCLMLLQSCSQKEFLDLQPKDKLTVGTTFTKYDNIKTYAWQFYEAFPGYNEAVPNQEFNSDLFLNANPNAESLWIWQRMTIPSSSDDYKAPYANIRAVNIMLDNLDNATITQEEKDHWRSVGYFFRAFNFYNLVNKYGDVIWVEKALADADKEVLYGKRTPRNEVTSKLLEQLQWAEAHIKPAGDGANTINVHVVRAFLARFGLMEGTWRKYHNLGDPQPFLRASADAAAKLVAAFPTLHPNYDEEFNSESLANVPGILLYKQYELNQVTHVLASRGRNSAGRWDLTKKAADMYLLKDGQTRWTSPQFAGDKSPYTEYRNRDKRLYFTTPPPFRVTVNHPSQTFTYTGNAADREYIDVMAGISNDKLKTLPTLNWQGLVVREEPHYVDYNQGQPFNVTYTGYRFYKFSNKILRVQNTDINDAPIFRMAEVLVNYAEAKYELGEFNQVIADQTINKLRARGGVAPLNLAAIPADPTRDAAVAPQLWEIRRERAIELMGEGFRFDDLRRWKKMEYAVQRKLGRWIKKGTDVPANSIIPIENGAAEGYIAYEGVPPGPFPEYYYLHPLPSNQTVMNPNLGQNPGWK